MTKTFGPAQKLLLLLAIVAVAVVVALVYYYFEAAVRNSIDYIWNDLFDTAAERWLVAPICLAVSLLLFGLQHYLDPTSEKHEAEGLGETPKPTLVNLVKVLLIGFFSLVAGASLGPEAILVPACLITGGLVGRHAFSSNKQAMQLLSLVGFVSLFAAFFDSFIAGMLGLLLVTKQTGVKITVPAFVIAGVASAVTVFTLSFFEGGSYMQLPANNFNFTVTSLLMMIVLLVGGIAVTYSLKASHDVFAKARQRVNAWSWVARALVAATGLTALYWLGGPLVEFTGNQSVQPMLQQASGLGIVGLAWLLIIKIGAIAWSKALGYRGGLVFPSVFAACVLVAIAIQIDPSVSFVPGFVVVMAGILGANAKLKVLF